jgi:hypothetical protein
MTMLRFTTEFTCKVCGEKLSFDLQDESSYLTKTGHEDFFGIQLTTYRVMHVKGDERHYNSVVVDQDGRFRAYRDAYTEPIDMEELAAGGEYWLYHEDGTTEKSIAGTHLALLISKTNRWIIDIQCPEKINITELVTLIMDRVEETYRVYSSPPQPLEMKFADLGLFVWMSESKVMCIDSSYSKAISRIDSLARIIVQEKNESVIPRKRALSVILKIVEIDPNPASNLITNILTSDMLFTTLQTPFEERIPNIVEHTSKKIPIASEILGPLLRGYTTILDVLETHPDRYREIFEVIDFINRRRILG